jgi:phage terminase small subunit
MGSNGNGLNNKQRVFVEEYLKCWNATEAARRAEYAHPNKQGPKLLVNLGISEAIEARIAELKMSADEVLLRLTEQARGEYGQYIGKNGQVDLSKLIEDGKSHLIKNVKRDRHGHLVVEFYDAQSALVHLGKAHALFTDNVDHSVKIDGKLVILPTQDG